MNSAPEASVIIPTYNRAHSLRRTLDSLARQTYDAGRFEVIVVDDGSEALISSVAAMHYPFELSNMRQANQGATAARNVGARRACGRTLVFLDDDINLVPDALAGLVETVDAYEKTIVLGDIRPVAAPGMGALARIGNADSSAGEPEGNERSYVVPFSDCMTGALAVHREDFLDLGMFEDPTDGHGWPNWDDIDFGYRAYLAGYEFRRSLEAVAYHRDHTLTDLPTSAERWRRAARAAVLLFRKHPRLQPRLRMFWDKSPISITHDSPTLIIDKLFHLVTAWRPVQWVLERMVTLLERVAPSSKPLLLLYRWIISGYIYQGYQEGLREYGPVQRLPTTEGTC